MSWPLLNPIVKIIKILPKNVSTFANYNFCYIEETGLTPLLVAKPKHGSFIITWVVFFRNIKSDRIECKSIRRKSFHPKSQQRIINCFPMFHQLPLAMVDGREATVEK